MPFSLNFDKVVDLLALLCKMLVVATSLKPLKIEIWNFFNVLSVLSIYSYQ